MLRYSYPHKTISLILHQQKVDGQTVTIVLGDDEGGWGDKKFIGGEEKILLLIIPVCATELTKCFLYQNDKTRRQINTPNACRFYFTLLLWNDRN